LRDRRRKPRRGTRGMMPEADLNAPTRAMRGRVGYECRRIAVHWSTKYWVDT
jgi:hypothetical protein